MDPILAAIEAIESQEPGEKFSYRQVAKKFGVDRTTLSRRHQGKTRSYATAGQQQMLLSPQQELELVRYIEDLSERALPPTREMIRNFASAVAKWDVSDAWVTRFLNRNRNYLTSQWTTDMDRNRHQADSEHSYRLYFELLHSKRREYNVDARHIYNMDEKGFLIGITSRSKRVFSKQLWLQKKITAGLQDGNREWITILACICADGTEIDPAIIYEGKGPLRDTWLHDVEIGKHQVFFATSSSGWTNNELGLAWLEQVFDRRTKEKARLSYRILIVDGHGSHLTPDFLSYCDANKILLMVFPPHSTHSLQPLDVVMFAPLSKQYSVELSRYLHQAQGLIPVKKSDFFPLFWTSYTSSFTRQNILKAFEATGVEPPDADAVLRRFKTTTPEQDEGLEFREHGDSSTWKQLRNLFDAAVKDTAKVEAKQLSASLHSLQVQNELLHHENQGLRNALLTKRKHNTRGKPLELY